MSYFLVKLRLKFSNGKYRHLFGQPPFISPLSRGQNGSNLLSMAMKFQNGNTRPEISMGNFNLAPV